VYSVDYFVGQLLIITASVAFCYYQSKKKNRDIAGWIILGLLFGLFACIIIAVLDPIKVEKSEVEK